MAKPGKRGWQSKDNGKGKVGCGQAMQRWVPTKGADKNREGAKGQSGERARLGKGCSHKVQRLLQYYVSRGPPKQAMASSSVASHHRQPDSRGASRPLPHYSFTPRPPSPPLHLLHPPSPHVLPLPLFGKIAALFDPAKDGGQPHPALLHPGKAPGRRPRPSNPSTTTTPAVCSPVRPRQLSGMRSQAAT